MHALSDYGLTPEQWQILQALWSSDDLVNQNEVAHLTLRDRHTVSRILVRMERDGWIERLSDPTDARVKLIGLTDKAKELREEIPRKLNEHFDRLLDVLDEHEHSELMRLLKKVRARLEG